MAGSDVAAVWWTPLVDIPTLNITESARTVIEKAARGRIR